MAYIPDEAIDNSHTVSHAAFKLYASYCRHRNYREGHQHFGLAWPARKLIHTETGICSTYISQLKQELTNAGWIETIGGKVRLLKGFCDSSEKSNSSTFRLSRSRMIQRKRRIVLLESRMVLRKSRMILLA